MNPSNGGSTNGNTNSQNFQNKIRILLVDDQKMIREGLKALLKTQTDIEVIGMADSGEAAIEQLESLQPDIILMDMEMPGVGGVTATETIRQKFPNIKILVLSTYDNDEYITRSISAGAMGYILKGTPAKDLTEAIRSVYKGYAQIAPGAYQTIHTLVSKSTIEKVQAKSPVNRAKPNKPSDTRHLLPSSESNEESEKSAALAVKQQTSIATTKFDQTVVLRQSPTWSRWIVWSIVGVTVFGLIWSAFAKIEQVVPAQGQLKPQGKVQEVQAPVNGVVETVYVKDGERVKKGQLLVRFDETVPSAEFRSKKSIRQTLQQENKFYRALMEQSLDPIAAKEKIIQFNLPTEIMALARSRIALEQENQVFKAELGTSSRQNNLDSNQTARLKASQIELNSRASAAKLEIEQLEKQLNQNQVQLSNARSQLSQAQLVLEQIKNRNQQSISQAESSLQVEQGIMTTVEPLVKEGAVSRLQLENQRQKVNDRNSTLIEARSNGAIEYDQQYQEVKNSQAEIQRFLEEEKRLRLDIAQAREQLTNTTAISVKDVLDKVAENDKKIAEIDTQLNKSIVENDKQIADLDSQISSAEQNLKYQELRAPVGGTVFDLQALPGYVQPAGQSEPVLKIVPNDTLVAEVYITNKDIGFVTPGMITDVRIDTFPFSEFGDIKGKIMSIGSDALPPDQTYNFFRFPARISLDKQNILVRGREIPLQSGMSISANIKVRENRTVLSLFTDKFITGIDKFKEVR